MKTKWIPLWLVVAATTTTLSACDDEIVDVDIPRDAAGGARDGASDAASAPEGAASTDGGLAADGAVDASAEATTPRDSGRLDVNVERANDGALADAASDRSSPGLDGAADARPEGAADAALDTAADTSDDSAEATNDGDPDAPAE